MWSVNFFKAAAERSVRAAASSLLSVMVVGDGVLNVYQFDWATGSGIALGGATVSFLMSLAGGAITNSGPSFNNTETVK